MQWNISRCNENLLFSIYDILIEANQHIKHAISLNLEDILQHSLKSIVYMGYLRSRIPIIILLVMEYWRILAN